MTPNDVLQLISSGETASVEFKRTLADSRKIIETVAAMATVGGGTILVGEADEGRLVGVDIGRGARERFTQQILTATDPRVYADLTVVRLHEQTLLVIEVPPGDGPHLAFGRAFYRTGPSTVQMDRNEYERRLIVRLRESGGFERRTDFTSDEIELAEERMQRFLQQARKVRNAPGGEVDVLQLLHLRSRGRLTAAAALLFGRWPQGPFPQATVRARVQRGGVLEAAAFEGDLFSQIDATTAFLEARVRNLTHIEGVRREVRPELPALAIREVVANAVAHRDYRSTAPTQVRLDERALTIWNAGHFPPPITSALLRQEHPSVPTNPLIARALYMAGYIEEWGTGTLRVLSALKANGNPEATFEELPGEGGVRVVLPLPDQMPAELDPELVSLLQGWPTGELRRSVEVAATLGVGQRTAQDRLRRLERLGLVGRVGGGRSVRWVRR